MNPDKKSGVNINVEADFQFIYDFETGVSLNHVAGFQFILPFRGPVVSASRIGVLYGSLRW